MEKLCSSIRTRTNLSVGTNFEDILCVRLQVGEGDLSIGSVIGKLLTITLKVVEYPI